MLGYFEPPIEIESMLFPYQRNVIPLYYEGQCELDGGTHLTDKVKKIDERRDKFSYDNGWTVIRFTAKDVKNDVLKCINELKTLL